MSAEPYKCPFCEVAYVDKCIVTECVKAPHFGLVPKGESHRNGCNGEATDGGVSVTVKPLRAPKGVVVGEIDLPEALVSRRKTTRLRTPDDDDIGPPRDATEVQRRRRIVAGDPTIQSCFTTYNIRTIVEAYKRLRSRVHEAAVALKQKPGSDDYKKTFRTSLEFHPLVLNKVKLNYRIAFSNFRLFPSRENRIHNGDGAVSIDDNFIIIRDENNWPTTFEKTRVVPLTVKIARTLPPDSPTTHARALAELVQLALENKSIEWWAYGTPNLNDDQFGLVVESFDHLYWKNQYNRSAKAGEPKP
ncbi:hypothetical protein [Paraburkholderia sediminicola]|uniref:hypothetical protein n=1 Tax=Paraburkholderia sediminicola TaxID=458836 RepID=UPI0038B9E3F5